MRWPPEPVRPLLAATRDERIAAFLFVVSALRIPVLRSLFAAGKFFVLPGRAISVAFSDAPDHWLAAAAVRLDSTIAPGSSPAHRRLSSAPPEPSNSPTRRSQRRRWLAAVSLRTVVPPDPPSAATSRYRWCPASPVAPQSDDPR